MKFFQIRKNKALFPLILGHEKTSFCQNSVKNKKKNEAESTDLEVCFFFFQEETTSNEGSPPPAIYDMPKSSTLPARNLKKMNEFNRYEERRKQEYALYDEKRKRISLLFFFFYRIFIGFFSQWQLVIWKYTLDSKF